MQSETLAVKSEKKEFYKLLWVTVIPLMVQTLFMQSITFIDQIMITSVGTDAVAAVGAANKILSIYNSFLYGSCTVLGQQRCPRLQKDIRCDHNRYLCDGYDSNAAYHTCP